MLKEEEGTRLGKMVNYKWETNRTKGIESNHTELLFRGSLMMSHHYYNHKMTNSENLKHSWYFGFWTHH